DRARSEQPPASERRQGCRTRWATECVPQTVAGHPDTGRLFPDDVWEELFRAKRDSPRAAWTPDTAGCSEWTTRTVAEGALPGQPAGSAAWAVAAGAAACDPSAWAASAADHAYRVASAAAAR